MAKVNMRATASAMFMIFTFLVAGGGPLVAGILSDTWSGEYGTDAIRYALLAISFLELLALLFVLKAAKTVQEDVL